MEGIFVLLSVGTSAVLIAHLLEYVTAAPHSREVNAQPYGFSSDVPPENARSSAEIDDVWYDEAA
jgi:hypothetical protein